MFNETQLIQILNVNTFKKHNVTNLILVRNIRIFKFKSAFGILMDSHFIDPIGDMKKRINICTIQRTRNNNTKKGLNECPLPFTFTYEYVMRLTGIIVFSIENHP